MYTQLPFSLSEGEEIKSTIKPVPTGYRLRYISGYIIIGIFVALWLSTFVFSLLQNIMGFLAIAIIIWLVIILIGVIFASISYNKFAVWVTNHRIISARGLIGYNTESMPLETIVDVVINRGIIDRILGLSSVMAVPMGGTPAYGRRSNFSTVGFIPALRPNEAMDLQKQILDLRNLRKKDLKE